MEQNAWQGARIAEQDVRIIALAKQIEVLLEELGQERPPTIESARTGAMSGGSSG